MTRLHARPTLALFEIPPGRWVRRTTGRQPASELTGRNVCTALCIGRSVGIGYTRRFLAIVLVGNLVRGAINLGTVDRALARSDIGGGRPHRATGWISSPVGDAALVPDGRPLRRWPGDRPGPQIEIYPGPWHSPIYQVTHITQAGIDQVLAWAQRRASTVPTVNWASR